MKMKCPAIEVDRCHASPDGFWLEYSRSHKNDPVSPKFRKSQKEIDYRDNFIRKNYEAMTNCLSDGLTPIPNHYPQHGGFGTALGGTLGRF